MAKEIRHERISHYNDSFKMIIVTLILKNYFVSFILLITQEKYFNYFFGQKGKETMMKKIREKG